VWLYLVLHLPMKLASAFGGSEDSEDVAAE
jgi:hypothetical protein